MQPAHLGSAHADISRATATPTTTDGDATGDGITMGVGTPSLVRQLHVAKPTGLLFHEYSDGRGYFEDAVLNGNGTAHLLFRHDGEPLGTVGTRNHIVWINEPDHLSRTAISIATESGHHEHVLVRHVPNATDLVLAGPYLYWGSLHWFGRVCLDGTQLNRRFIRVSPEHDGGVEDGMTTDGRYLYFTQCLAGRIGRVPIAAASTGGAVSWLVVDPDDRDFCAQALTLSGTHLFYDNNNSIGRIGVNGSGRDDRWHPLPAALITSGSLIADSHDLYWNYGASPNPASSHIAQLTTSGRRLRQGLYDDVDQGVALAP
jgi:hypothetical protein